ncbi:serine hydrolase [Balneolaceae bacterium YR4-1]|uniref:Serine hydrolase n=1 Tax=Halalkalibaculum roseum TaxID=2709311 RepID=A0A6M1SQQ7_9BACT|nr:serine hydrolase [Halalkalibaculum roseum]NGP75042.1 serine hydrolase [Halalkalibaculum roseum]
MMNKIIALLITAFLVPCLSYGQETEVSLHAAVLQGKNEIVRQHVEAGADLNQKDAYGSTPLIIATTFDKPEAADILIEGGADLEITNNEGSTPLHIAALFGRVEIVRMLLDGGADRLKRNNEGSTAYDIVAAPFEEDKGLYDQLGMALGPLGFSLDYEQVRKSRPVIARMLRPTPEELRMVDYRPLPSEEWSISTPEKEGLDPNLVSELYYDAGGLETNYSLLVIKNGKLVAEHYYHEGGVDQKTQLQSVTKSYTSALVGIALEKGCLESVDQKMMNFFPELADSIDDSRKEQITIRQLLQMRAGYPWEESTKELFEQLYEGFHPSTLVDIDLSRDPDTDFQYSNLSSHILGIIVSRACDSDLKSFAMENLLGPLNTEPGEWTQHWEGYYGGAAGLRLMARDLAKFGQLYLDDGIYKREQIVPSPWVETSLQSYSHDVNTGGLNNGSVGRYLRHIGYGYQWWSAEVDGYRFNLAWGHGGQFIFLLDEYNMVIVITSDPMQGRHDAEAWKHERANINLAGKFIQALVRSENSE